MSGSPRGPATSPTATTAGPGTATAFSARDRVVPRLLVFLGEFCDSKLIEFVSGRFANVFLRLQPDQVPG